jgi:hypothetical protein
MPDALLPPLPQRLLDNMRRPATIQPLVLESLDLGVLPPLVRAVRAVAGEMNAAGAVCVFAPGVCMRRMQLDSA